MQEGRKAGIEDGTKQGRQSVALVCSPPLQQKTVLLANMNLSSRLLPFLMMKGIYEGRLLGIQKGHELGAELGYYAGILPEPVPFPPILTSPPGSINVCLLLSDRHSVALHPPPLLKHILHPGK